MEYNPYLPNPLEVINETLLTENFHYLIFLGWTAIVIVGMFCFCIMQCISLKYKENKIVLRTELGISVIIKFLIWVQFFPGGFYFTFYYFFVIIIIFLFTFEYFKSLKFLLSSRLKFISILIFIFLIYSFYLVSVRNLYNSTFRITDVYTTEDMLKYVR